MKRSTTKEKHLELVDQFVHDVISDNTYDITIRLFILTHVLREITRHIVDALSNVLSFEDSMGLNTTSN